MFIFLISSIQNNLFSQPLVIDGTLDLRDHQFENYPILSLDGEWEFYWMELLDSSQVNTEEKNYRQFTKAWTDGDTYSAFGYATYKLTIFLPSHHPQISLHIPDFYSSYELFVDGDLIAANGKVGTSKQDYTPKWIPQNVALETSGKDKIQLVLQVANFHHQRGGAYEAILLGESTKIAQKREKELAFSYILTGTLLMSSFFFLGLYLFGKHEKSILFFSIFCLIYSYRIIGFGIYPLHFLLPDIPWIIYLKLEYLTLFFSGLFFGIYTLNLYPREASKQLINILSSLSVIFALTTLFFPVHWFTKLVTPYFAILIIYIIYAFWIYIRAWVRKRDGANFALASTGVVFFVFLYEMMVYFGILSSSLTFSFLGYLFFFSLQSLVLTFRFSTSLKRAITKAEDASKAKSQFLSTMSHEIRTPLNAIIGLSGLLKETPLNATQDDYVKTVKVSGENLLSIINNILDYSKIESSKISLQFSEVDIQELIENVLDLVAPLNINANVELIYDLDDSVTPFIYTDQVKFQQILINLINNAIKFTEKGEVFVRLTMEDIPSGDFSKLGVTIKDTGIGIPKSSLKKLFQSFSQVDASTTRKYGGTGLGLVISKRLVEALGGEISVKSNVDEGTEFNFFIKVKKSSRKQPPFQSEILKGKKVLFLDDNETNLKIFEQQGLSHGLKITTTTNPSRVTDKIETLDEFDFLVLDMQMPNKDGVDIAKRIRSKWNKTELPLVLLSSIHEVDNNAGLQLFNLHLTKPVKQSQLFRSLESIFTTSLANTSSEVKESEVILRKKDKLKILVAEDNIFNQKVAEKILERLGYKPIIVENGKEAFNAVLNNTFDLIFMDVEMPLMDGIETTVNLRKEEQKLQKRPIIIAMTANALAEDKRKCIEAGMDDFISKPVTIETLNKMIKKWF